MLLSSNADLTQKSLCVFGHLSKEGHLSGFRWHNCNGPQVRLTGAPYNVKWAGEPIIFATPPIKPCLNMPKPIIHLKWIATTLISCTVYFRTMYRNERMNQSCLINHALTNFDKFQRWKTEDTEGLLRFVVIEQSHLLKTQKLCNTANEKILLWCILFVSLRSCLTSWLSIANFANKFSAIMNNWYPHFLIAMFSNKENAIPNPKAVTFKTPQFTVTIPRASG